MEPTPITALSEGPINDLVFALDHYFVVGEHLGEGAGADSTDSREWIVFLAVNPREPSDVTDFKRLRLRLAEINQKAGIVSRLEKMPNTPTGTSPRQRPYGLAVEGTRRGSDSAGPHEGEDPKFHIHWLYVPKDRSRELCRILMDNSGAAGWGGFYPKMGVLDQAALRMARYAGVALQSVQRSTADAIRLDLVGVVSAEVLEVGLHGAGETGQPVEFWHVRGGEYYLFDPTFTDHAVNFADLVYNSDIGLHEKGDD